jgi:hypothetical protein
MKRTKANISSFELMKLPKIQENFIKNIQGNGSMRNNKINVGTRKGESDVEKYIDNTTPKINSVVNESLTG